MVTFHPYSLFRVRNSPYQMGLTPFEIMHGLPSPLVPSLQDKLVLPTEEVNHLGSLRALSQIQADTWPQLRALYSSYFLPDSHSFQLGDWVLIHRHQGKSLEPWWKGPYVVILTAATALKVDGISTWILQFHTRPVASTAEKLLSRIWEVSKRPTNPLKLKLQQKPKNEIHPGDMVPATSSVPREY